MNYQHTPVLVKETLEFLNANKGGTFIDCTLGGGSHTEAILTSPPIIPLSIFNGEGDTPTLVGEGVRIFGFDQDQNALDAAKERLAKFENIEYIHDNFKHLKKHIKKPVDGILFDLGVSSHQIDEASSGFSLQKDGPLDMRMDHTTKLTAKDIINNFKQEELEKIFKEFGEERFSHRVAKAIVKERATKEINSTFQLKPIIEKAIPTWKKRESVTRIFQSLRIAVNDELEVLTSALLDAIDLLKPGARIVVISYHSLEDRIVKHTFRKAPLTILTKKPVQTSMEELASNKRARSAKLRAGEKQ